MQCVKQMKEIDKIVNAINQSNQTVRVPKDLLEYRTQQLETPKSFYECFGREADPYQTLVVNSSMALYLTKLTGNPIEGHVTSNLIARLVANGVDDAEFVQQARLDIEHNRALSRALKVLPKEELQDFSCRVVRKNYQILLEGDSLKLYHLLHFKGVAKNLVVPEGFRAFEISPVLMVRMIESYKQMDFFKHTEFAGFVHRYDKAGFYNDLKQDTPVGQKVNSFKVHNRTLAVYTYKALALALKAIEEWGGQMVFYRPFAAVVFVPEDISQRYFLNHDEMPTPLGSCRVDEI